MYSFFTGNFKQAMVYNFSVFCGLLLGFFLMILLNIYVFFQNEYCIKIIRWVLRPIVLMTFIVAYIIFGLLRNFI